VTGEYREPRSLVWQETGECRRLGRVGEGSNRSRDESCRGRRIQVPVYVESATAWMVQSSCRSNRKVLSCYWSWGAESPRPLLSLVYRGRNRMRGGGKSAPSSSLPCRRDTGVKSVCSSGNRSMQEAGARWRGVELVSGRILSGSAYPGVYVCRVGDGRAVLSRK
jgi:hypothetical protein